MTYLELDGDGDEARPVEVQMDDGIWVPGSLEAYRKVEGVWSGFVRYTLAAGATQSGWFEEGRVRGHAD